MSSEIIEAGLSGAVLDVHRALASLQEELEAIDWYHQRAAMTDDPELKAVLEHNRDDEVEHMAMLLEWLRRSLPGFDLQLRRLLFRSGAITAPAADVPAPSGAGLGLGNLKGGRS